MPTMSNQIVPRIYNDMLVHQTYMMDTCTCKYVCVCTPSHLGPVTAAFSCTIKLFVQLKYKAAQGYNMHLIL